MCAIRASQLGLKTALVEKRKGFGGTCINVGCIPSKALLDSSHKYKEALHDLQDHGIQTGEVKLDLKRMMSRKDQVVHELVEGLNFLMKKNKIDCFHATGSLEGVQEGKITIEVTGAQKQKLTGKNCVLAVGSEIIQLPGIEPDGKQIITSDDAIGLTSVPQSMIIIGAGVIGLELGSVWSRLGTKITIVEQLPSILPAMDQPLRDLSLNILKKQGLEFLLGNKVLEVSKKAKKVEVQVQGEDGSVKKLEAEKLLVAVGRKPYTENLGIEKVGLKISPKGKIEAPPPTLATNLPNVYAIGDVIEGAMLAHRAEEEGIMIAERLAGKVGHVNYEAIPWVVYTWPEIAWVGRSEEQLKKEGVSCRSGKFFFKANGRAKAMQEEDGQVKMIADAETDRILGVFIVGPNASELIAEAAIAMEFGASAEDIARSFHAHPTLAEAVREAALSVDGRSIHS